HADNGSGQVQAPFHVDCFLKFARSWTCRGSRRKATYSAKRLSRVFQSSPGFIRTDCISPFGLGLPLTLDTVTSRALTFRGKYNSAPKESVVKESAAGIFVPQICDSPEKILR